MTQENYSKRLEHEMHSLAFNIQELIGGAINDIGVDESYGTYCLEFNNQPIGHRMTRPQLLSQVYAINKVLEIIREHRKLNLATFAYTKEDVKQALNTLDIKTEQTQEFYEEASKQAMDYLTEDCAKAMQDAVKQMIKEEDEQPPEYTKCPTCGELFTQEQMIKHNREAMD